MEDSQARRLASWSSLLIVDYDRGLELAEKPRRQAPIVEAVLLSL